MLKLMTRIIIRLPEKIKDAYKQICEEEYTDMSTDVRDFVISRVKERKK